jgi:hypothetical protein
MSSRLHSSRGSAAKFDKSDIEFEEGVEDYELPSTPVENSETLSTPTYELIEGTDYTLEDNIVSLVLDSDFCALLTTGTIIKVKWSYK